MKKFNLHLIILIVFLFKVMCASSQTVYITKSGSKYHKGSCRYLKSSKRAIDFKKAQELYSACSVCKPSAPNKSSKSSVKNYNSKRSETDVKSTSKSTTRCTATTKAGTRCKRNSSASSSKCWQHSK